MTEITTPEPMPTPLLDRHEALGAKIVEFAGWLMPISYAGILEEHRAVRSAAGLFDLSHMGELVVEGPEAGMALAAALVTDPPSLAVGRAHYSMICAPDGGILDDLIVYRLAPERFMVVANASNSRTVSDALAARLDGFGAVLDDRSLATGLVAIQGPRSLEILQPLAGVDLASIRYYGIAEGVVAGIPAQVARTGYTGEDGGPGRPDRLHRRGRLRAVPRCRAGRGGMGRGPRSRASARSGAGRPGGPRHPAPRGRHAAVRQRAGPGHDTVRGGP
jgi:glycine cleavage system aminomethyltransferase T